MGHRNPCHCLLCVSEQGHACHCSLCASKYGYVCQCLLCVSKQGHACLSVYLFVSLHSSMFRAVHPQALSKVDVDHRHIPVCTFRAIFVGRVLDLA